MLFLFFFHLIFIISFSLSSNFLLSTSSNPLFPSIISLISTFNSHFWCYFFWEYGSTPTSLFFLEFELPNSEILICITHSSPTALQKPHGHSTPLKSSGQNKRGGQKGMLSSETILSLLTQVTREQIRGLFIYILHHVQTKTLEKRNWLTSSSLDWKGTFVRLFISNYKSLRVKYQMEMNQTIPLWAESNFPCLAGATLLRSLSPSSSQPGQTNIVENRPPHHWIKKWFRTEQKKDNSTLLYSSAQHRNISKIQMRVTGLWCAHQPPPPRHACESCSPRQALFNLGTFWYIISLKWSKILLYFQAKSSSSLPCGFGTSAWEMPHFMLLKKHRIWSYAIACKNKEMIINNVNLV